MKILRGRNKNSQWRTYRGGPGVLDPPPESLSQKKNYYIFADSDIYVSTTGHSFFP